VKREKQARGLYGRELNRKGEKRKKSSDLHFRIDEEVNGKRNKQWLNLYDKKQVIIYLTDLLYNSYLPAPCPSPRTPIGGYRIDNDFSHGKIVRFGCLGKRRVFGSPNITCNDGKWYSEPPKCLWGM
jgi:hypothetical protein